MPHPSTAYLLNPVFWSIQLKHNNVNPYAIVSFFIDIINNNINISVRPTADAYVLPTSMNCTKYILLQPTIDVV